jgi:nucleoporin p58/p45
LFGGFGSAATSQSQQQGGLFGSASSQSAQSGGLFGAAASQPAAGGLFSSTTSQPATGGLFGAATSQPAQSSGLFGAAKTQTASTGGLFGTATSQAAPSGGLFGSTSQPTHSGGLFGSATSQPAQSGGLFGAASTQPSQGGSLYGAMPSQPSQSLFSNTQTPQPPTFLGGSAQGGAAKPAATLNLGQQSTLGHSSSSARIDLEHLRPTTKFDQLTEDLQREILNLDTLILNEINRCNEVANLLPAIAATGSNIPNDVTYVTQKLEEVETGLENDAEDIQNLKEQIVKKDANEAKTCFREVDRLKMPSQYQASVAGPTASVSGVYAGHGLSGWWNHPQTLQRSVRGGTGAGGSRTLQLPGEDEDTLAGGPANLIDFFEQRTEEMKKALGENKSLLTEIEEFVFSVENKVATKQREVMGRDGRVGIQGEEDPIGLLHYVFGEFERSLYEVAGKVGGARDGVHELVLGNVGDHGRSNQRVAW